MRPHGPPLGRSDARTGRLAELHILERADEEARELLHGQALVAEGSPLGNPARFATHITALLADAASLGDAG